jgi:hypothetical protein
VVVFLFLLPSQGEEEREDVLQGSQNDSVVGSESVVESIRQRWQIGCLKGRQ